MISREYLKALGYYIPQRFTLFLPEIKLPLASDDKKGFTIFIHEYTHLLQNIFSLSGWTSFAYESLKYEAILDHIKEEKAYNLPLYNKIKDKKINTSSNYKGYLFSMDKIDRKSKIEALDNTNKLKSTIISDFPVVENNKGIKIFSQFLVDGKIVNININYLVLIESMAYIVERHYGLSDIPSPDYPYNVISILFSKTPLHAKLDKQIIILYMSLQSSFPDILFRNIYECVIDEKLYEIKNNDDFAIAIKKKLNYHFTNNCFSQIEMLKKVINQFCSIISIFPPAKHSANWISEITSIFFNKICGDTLFYIRPIIERKGSSEIFGIFNNNYFLISDSNKKLSTIKNRSTDDYGITFLSNLFHFIDYFLYYQSDEKMNLCPMFSSCALEKFKDEKCIYSPYEKGSLLIEDALCNYGVVAHMFFTHEIPVILPTR